MTTGWALALVAIALLMVAIVALCVGLGHLDRRLAALEQQHREQP